MSDVYVDGEVPVYDLVGVGFGPSNLALAIALVERDEPSARSGAELAAVFLERQAGFGWHRGMLIDDANMQVSFLKDLVTLRNPASEFSFLCYLHSRDRLVDFINHKNLFPLRIEFHDYLEWAAAKVAHLVRYGQEVAAVRPVFDGAGELVCFDVVVRDTGETGAAPPRVYRARNVVFGMGLEPYLPAGVVPGARIWHNRDLLPSAARLPVDGPSRFVVVGAGQSAAETTAFLHQRFPEAEVCAVFTRFGYSPSDDSSFANQIFDPAAVDEFFGAPHPVKQMIMDYHRNTNYSAVDSDLIDDLFRRVYREKVLGVERLRMLHASRVAEVVSTDHGVRATVESLTTGAKQLLDADVVVYATGYRPVDPVTLAGDVGRYLLRDPEDRLRVGRDYRVLTTPQVRAGIYLHGPTEHTHGISSTLLSNTAVRSAEILDSIDQRQPALR